MIDDIKSTIITVLGVIVVALFILAGIVGIGCLLAPSREEIAKDHALQVIKEFDNCKVYRFYDRDYHYITKCGDKVITEKNWDEYCGKACTRHRTENITTEGNQ
jgi:hypothetical protein